jgi:8-oxo-dGTP pyrophosphatase MutT (NUDIX family)
VIIIRALEKVSIFITRNNGGQKELLFIQHPTAGIQIPAGTVEYGETHFEGAIREAKEETGLTSFDDKRYIGYQETNLSENQCIIMTNTKVYSRPDPTSSDWAGFRRGIPVTIARKEGGFTQINYTEYDRFPECNYVTYSITGWVPDEVITQRVERHFYHFEVKHQHTTKDNWEQFTDNNLFNLFWSPLSKLPRIVSPQDQWIEYVKKQLHYSFDI